MAAETGQAIISALWTRITTDTTLKSVLGSTIRLYRVMAAQDAPMPYLVHRLALGSELLHGTHTYYLDLWDYSDDTTRIDSAVDRIKVLLQHWHAATGDSEIGAGIMRWFSGGYIPTDAEKVWHYATMWNIRFGAARDITRTVG